MKKIFNKLTIITLITTIGWSATLETWKSHYTSGADVWIELKDKSDNPKDWVGIYPLGSSNAWGNVVDWRWSTKTSTTQVDQGDWYKFDLKDGKYEARFFLNNSFVVNDSAVFSVGKQVVEKPSMRIGAGTVNATAKNKAKLFASPYGNGDCLSYESACNIYDALDKLTKSNNVLFLKGGTYEVTKELIVKAKGTQDRPIIIESYPEEKAVIKGDKKTRLFYVGGQNKHVKLRKLEIMHSGGKAITLMRTSKVTIEGCKIHHNYGSGISLYSASNNKMLHNIIYENSDELLPSKGGNADGIQIIYGKLSHENIISHNTVYRNSDDGIDTIGGSNTVISYNVAYKNRGLEGGANGGPGNGIGIKACGRTANGSQVSHNIAFENKGNGMECNLDNNTGVSFAFNTSYNNGGHGFGLSYSKNVSLKHNIATHNTLDQVTAQSQENNSWQIDDTVPFIDTYYPSENFLKPMIDSDFEEMGAYAD